MDIKELSDFVMDLYIQRTQSDSTGAKQADHRRLLGKIVPEKK